MNIFNQNQQFPMMDEQNFWDFESFNANDQSNVFHEPNSMNTSPYELNQQNIKMLNNQQFIQSITANVSNNSTIDSSSPDTIKSPINALNGINNIQIQAQTLMQNQNHNQPLDSGNIASPIKLENIPFLSNQSNASSGPPTKRQRSSSKSSSLTAQEQKELELVNKDDSELTEQELYMKRKAQNRAAQRAFRERKEHKLKELESKLSKSEEQRTKLLGELEEIKQRNISIATENEILKTNGTFSNFSNNSNQNVNHSTFTFPKSESDFVNSLVSNKKHKITKENYKINYKEPSSGAQVLTVGAVWDYLMKRTEDDGLEIDIISVMSKLKGNEKCHGYGPAYPLELIENAIRDSLN